MKLRVLQDEKFSCHSCTTCCRDWHVELQPGEVENLRNLDWPGNDPLRGVDPILRHGGRMFIAHRTDGACLFLNLSNGRCRIHEQFGGDAKPLGCRLFPFQISPTFKGEASVIGRCDCPTIRKNLGEPHSAHVASLKRCAEEMGLSGKFDGEFDDATRCFLDREQIEAVCEFICTLMAAFKDDVQRVLFIAFLCDWLATTQIDELDRSALAKAFGELKQQVEETTALEPRRLGMMGRLAFRSLLGMYLRRDEDILNGRAGRIGRAIAMAGFVIGGGGFRGLGLFHPAGTLKKARLFKKSGAQPSDPAALALFWRVIRNRLESFQFMGQANNGRNFLEGLRSLVLLYPLVMAAAKYHAGNRDSQLIEEQDVDYAVAAIEHSFGRRANSSYTQPIERLLLDRAVVVRLVRGI